MDSYYIYRVVVPYVAVHNLFESSDQRDLPIAFSGMALNPVWPHFAGIFTLVLACLLGLFHLLFNGYFHYLIRLLLN